MANPPQKRCSWARTPLSIAYHDAEWGVPVHDDRVLFEFLTLEGAQARTHAGIRRAEQRAAAARVQVRRPDDLLCLHAGDRNGERSYGGLFPPRPLVRFDERTAISLCSSHDTGRAAGPDLLPTDLSRLSHGTPTQLARHLAVGKPALSAAVKRLVGLGHIRVERSRAALDGLALLAKAARQITTEANRA